MDSQLLVQLRALVDQCLEGQEPVDVVAPRVAAVMAAYYAGCKQAPGAELPLPHILRAPRGAEERERLRCLCDALLQYGSNDHPTIEYLPLDDSGPGSPGT
ncbi:MAG: hypothetical protein OEY20_10715 [Gemmatimonadota bacterium]|nr:hypothetical protein [Gemmatimonadota bacterium]MDH5197714.1 hypothetical protein [Gemmatimonadota bacterium]